MDYDAMRRQVVLFGGEVVEIGQSLRDTWTWDGTDWTQRPAGSIRLSVHSGPPGTLVTVQGWGFLARERVRIVFTDSVNGNRLLVKVKTDRTGAFSEPVTTPAGATPGVQHLRAQGVTSGQLAKARFIVSRPPGRSPLKS